MESEEELKWKNLADNHWLKDSTRAHKVNPQVLKQDIWDALEKDDLNYRSLLILDNLQLLERSVWETIRCILYYSLTIARYLWPGYNEDASNYHVLLVALMVTVKSREGLPTWSTV